MRQDFGANFRRTVFLAASALAMTLGSAYDASSQVIILQSSGPNAATYYPGRVLPSTKAIHLKQGDRLMIKSGDETRTVVGPGEVTSPPPPSFIEMLKVLLSQDSQNSLTVTATRGADDDNPDRQNLWLVDIGSQTDFCVSSDARPKIVRWTTQFPTKLVVDAGPGHPELTVPWPAGASTLSWPEALPMKDGASYAIRVDDKDPITLVWHKVDPPSASMTKFVNQLHAKGCQQQLDVITGSLAR